MLPILFFLILSVFFPTVVSAHSEVQIIEMTKDGFNPQSVTVDHNQTIIFLNRDDVPRWPASNSHPMHDVYPEFDPKNSIEPGASWPFKPQKIGTWKYHDHLFPHMRGIIVVNAESSVVKTMDVKEKLPEENLSQKTREKKGLFYIAWDAITKLFTNIQQIFMPQDKLQSPSKTAFIQLPAEKQSEMIKQIAKDDPKDAWKYLKDVYKNENGAAGNVHDLAHSTGNLLYSSYGLKGLSFCSEEFAFGCYHGFLDKAFAENLDQLLDAERACLELDARKEVSGPVASCIHGIGHGVASYYLTEDLEASLETCNKLTKGDHYCFDGVFMEFVRNAPDTFFHKDNPLYPCNQFENEETYAVACGRNQPSLLLNRFQMRINDVATACESSTSVPFKKACFDAIGFVLASYGNVDQVISGCYSITDTNFRTSCMQAAAGELVFQQVPGWVEKSRAVCKALPTDSQTECLDYVQNIMNEYGRKAN
jgi:hypothetical protein